MRELLWNQRIAPGLTGPGLAPSVYRRHRRWYGFEPVPVEP